MLEKIEAYHQKCIFGGKSYTKLEVYSEVLGGQVMYTKLEVYNEVPEDVAWVM